MKTTDRNALIAFPILILIGLLVALAGSQGGSRVAGIPVFALLVGLAFLIQWLVFIPAYWRQTEKFFDLTRQPHLYHRQHAGPVFERWRGWQSDPGVGAGCDLGSPPGHLPVQPHQKSGQG
jgi:hypothetical protein